MTGTPSTVRVGIAVELRDQPRRPPARHLRLQRGDDDVLAALAPAPPFVEQPERLADARGVAEEDLQLTAPRGLLGGLRPGAAALPDRPSPIAADVGGAWPSISTAAIRGRFGYFAGDLRGRARGSARRTLTRGSPMNPSHGPFGVLLRPALGPAPASTPRALATRAAWMSALAGLMCGSRPLPTRSPRPPESARCSRGSPSGTARPTPSRGRSASGSSDRGSSRSKTHAS